MSGTCGMDNGITVNTAVYNSVAFQPVKKKKGGRNPKEKKVYNIVKYSSLQVQPDYTLVYNNNNCILVYHGIVFSNSLVLYIHYSCI